MSLPVLFRQGRFKNSRMVWILILELKAGFPSLLHCKISAYLKRKTCPKAPTKTSSKSMCISSKKLSRLRELCIEHNLWEREHTRE